MTPLATLVYQGQRYPLTDEGWSGPDPMVVDQLNTLFPPTDYRTSTAVVPAGYECARAASESYKCEVEWPPRTPSPPDLIH